MFIDWYLTMIFYSLFILLFSTFCVSSLAVSSFHLSQFLGVLPVTDLAVLLEVSANLIRQIISLTFLVMSLSGLGLASCTFIFVINQSSKNREIESFFRRFGLQNTRFERRRHHFQVEDEIPLPTKLQPFEKHRRNDNILSFFDVKRMN